MSKPETDEAEKCKIIRTNLEGQTIRRAVYIFDLKSISVDDLPQVRVSSWKVSNPSIYKEVHFPQRETLDEKLTEEISRLLLKNREDRSTSEIVESTEKPIIDPGQLSSDSDSDIFVNAGRDLTDYDSVDNYSTSKPIKNKEKRKKKSKKRKKKAHG